MRVHLVVFLVAITSLTVLDLAQGVDSESTFLTLDWAHLLFVLWMPIFLVHALASWWGGKVDGLDDETMRGLQGRWFGGYSE